MHIRVKRIYHRRYPETRGEGRTLGEASRHLARQLACSLEFALGPRRDEIERALDDVRALRHAGVRPRRQPVAAIG